jgi:hypothetical protein
MKVMKSLCLALLMGVFLVAPAAADLCTIDDVPAATLLLPYFEVDLEDENGVTTLFSVNNASASATLAHVVLWSDLSVPTLDFDVYLTGYDVQTFNIRDLFDGILPVTASDGQDPEDTISPQGPISQDINFASCTGKLPFSNPELNAVQIAHLRAAHTGGLSPILGACAGLPFGDGIARGYVTVDVVNECSLEFPSTPGYFGAGGTGIAGNRNILWGNYHYVNPAENFASGETLVHVEADTTTSLPTWNTTFYGRYTLAGEDNREPLPSQHAARYLNGGAFSGGTDLVVWRESTIVDVDGFACGTFPAWFPLSQNQVVAFDEEETPVEVCIAGEDAVSPPTGEAQTCFPAEAQRVSVADGNEFSDAVAPPFDFGWIFLDLGYVSIANGPDEPPQSWVTTIMSADDRFSTGMDAIQLNDGCTHIVGFGILGV